jgi:uncharacterized protein YqjF (DUF2071 family)
MSLAEPPTRQPPPGIPLVRQDWCSLLFMHWRIDAALLRPLIPERLTIDTYDGSAWIAIVPFTIRNMSPFPPKLPRIPGFNAMHELNVRTYATLDGVPGVWFFSLDVTHALAMVGARVFYHLPYFTAGIEIQKRDSSIAFTHARTGPDGPQARFDVKYTILNKLPATQPGSLEYFLVERYCLYAARDDALYRARIFHQPWPLHSAELHSFDSTVIQAAGLPCPEGLPLLHYAPEVNADIWRPIKV